MPKDNLPVDEANNNSSFGHFIKELRIKRDWTIAEVADKLNISINYVSQLERGLRRPTDELIKNFSQLYRIDEQILYQKAERLSPTVKEELVSLPSLQKALRFIKRKNLPTDRKKELEQELIDVFTEFLEVHKEDLLREDETNGSDIVQKHTKKEE